MTAITDEQVVFLYTVFSKTTDGALTLGSELLETGEGHDDVIGPSVSVQIGICC